MSQLSPGWKLIIGLLLFFSCKASAIVEWLLFCLGDLSTDITAIILFEDDTPLIQKTQEKITFHLELCFWQVSL